jgi:hypothetical protein
MSNKYCGLCVTFEKEISEEYASILKQMIMSFKGVCDVSPIISDIEHHIAYAQAKNEIKMKIISLLTS